MKTTENNKKIKNFDFYMENSLFFQNNPLFLENCLNIINKNERLEDLQYDGRCIIQNPNGYCFTSDSVLLANFAKPKTNNSLLELCAGCGVISILINAKNKISKTQCVELQKPLYELCQKNFVINEINNVSIINDNLKNYKTWFRGENFDCVVCNPPYEKECSSFPKYDIEKSIARCELETTFDEIAKVASKTLKYGGAFYFLSKTERLCENFTSLIKYKLEPKTLQLIYEKPNTISKVYLCKAVLGGKSGLEVFSPIIRCDENGKESTQIKKIYNR